MEKSLNYFLKTFVLLLILTLFSCGDSYDYFEKEFNKEESIELAEQLMNGMGYVNYYQGHPGEQMLIKEAEKYNPDLADIAREKGIPYLKRGMGAKAFPHYNRMVELDEKKWLGNRGYCWLYFYRDYERALIDFDTLDAWTPNQVDYPFAISADYMRAICYLKLDNPKTALEYIDKHIENEIKTVGENYIKSVAFIVKGQAHEALNDLDGAQAIYERAVAAHPKNADVKYYLGKLLLKRGNKSKAAELLSDARYQFNKRESNSRPYVEEFFQVYIQDIEEAQMRIDKKHVSS